MKVNQFLKASVLALFVISSYQSISWGLSLEEQTDVYNTYTLEAKADYAGAVAKMIKIQAANTDNYFVNYRLGYLLSMTKKYSNAAVHYEKAAQIETASVEPWLALSLMYFYAADDSKVISSSKEILKRDSKNYYGLLRLAGAQIRTKDFAGALETSSEGLKNYPLDATLLEQKGASLKALGKADDAKKVAQQLIVISPANVFAKTVLTK